MTPDDVCRYTHGLEYRRIIVPLVSLAQAGGWYFPVLGCVSFRPWGLEYVVDHLPLAAKFRDASEARRFAKEKSSVYFSHFNAPAFEPLADHPVPIRSMHESFDQAWPRIKRRLLQCQPELAILAPLA